MKLSLKKISCVVAGLGALSCADLFAAFSDLPRELREEISTYLPVEVVREYRLVDRLTNEGVVAVNTNDPKFFNQQKFLEKFQRIEELLELDQFIPLSDMPNHPSPTDAIRHIGVSQELWFEVMGNNPSRFKEKKYCPETYREVEVIETDGTIEKVPLCPELPVERVQIKNGRERNSNEEFIDRFNIALALAHKDFRVRSATVYEYLWADTEGEKNPKRVDDPDFWQYVTHHLISNKAPLDLSQPSPSGESQPHGVKAKKGNAFGFKRSGVWELTGDIDRRWVIAVGGSWFHGPWDGASEDKRMGVGPLFSESWLGAARLVRTTFVR